MEQGFAGEQQQQDQDPEHGYPEYQPGAVFPARIAGQDPGQHGHGKRDHGRQDRDTKNGEHRSARLGG